MCEERLLLRSPFPKYSLACLQLAADGFTLEEVATYIGRDPDFVESCLEDAKRRLMSSTLEQAVARAITLGMIA
jgi:hypothetical protein